MIEGGGLFHPYYCLPRAKRQFGSRGGGWNLRLSSIFDERGKREGEERGQVGCFDLLLGAGATLLDYVTSLAIIYGRVAQIQNAHCAQCPSDPPLSSPPAGETAQCHSVVDALSSERLVNLDIHHSK